MRFTKQGVKWKRTRNSHHAKQDPQQLAIKQADLDMLELAAAARDIDLGYLAESVRSGSPTMQPTQADESGFGLWSPVSYSYFFQGEQKYLEQTKRRGSRVSILGIWQPLVAFEYGLAIGGFDSESYIKIMDWQAKIAAQVLAETGRIRVIAQDCGPIHTSGAVKAKLSEWEAQGLYIFYFAKYCSEMNPIELEWQRLKEDEIAGRMFEHELDLAYAVMDAVTARSQLAGQNVERFKFCNSSVP